MDENKICERLRLERDQIAHAADEEGYRWADSWVEDAAYEQVVQVGESGEHGTFDDETDELIFEKIRRGQVMNDYFVIEAFRRGFTRRVREYLVRVCSAA
jgi:hypothetical protein